MKARIVKGGWFWLGTLRVTGEIIYAPSAAWIANREGLVEAIADEPSVPVIEAAMLAPPETAVLPRARARKHRE